MTPMYTAHAVADFAGRDAGAAAVAGYLAVQQALSAIDIFTTTRRGPRMPRCSQMDDEPGPPLKAKHTGRGGAPAQPGELVPRQLVRQLHEVGRKGERRARPSWRASAR